MDDPDLAQNEVLPKQSSKRKRWGFKIKRPETNVPFPNLQHHIFKYIHPWVKPLVDPELYQKKVLPKHSCTRKMLVAKEGSEINVAFFDTCKITYPPLSDPHGCARSHLKKCYQNRLPSRKCRLPLSKVLNHCVHSKTCNIISPHPGKTTSDPYGWHRALPKGGVSLRGWWALGGRMRGTHPWPAASSGAACPTVASSCQQGWLGAPVVGHAELRPTDTGCVNLTRQRLAQPRPILQRRWAAAEHGAPAHGPRRAQPAPPQTLKGSRGFSLDSCGVKKGGGRKKKSAAKAVLH